MARRKSQEPDLEDLRRTEAEMNRPPGAPDTVTSGPRSSATGAEALRGGKARRPR